MKHDGRGPQRAEIVAGGRRLSRHCGQVAEAQQRLHELVRDLLAECAATGDIRDDIAPDELAGYCLHALAAASSLPSKAAVRRLVTLTLDGLKPPR